MSGAKRNITVDGVKFELREVHTNREKWVEIYKSMGVKEEFDDYVWLCDSNATSIQEPDSVFIGDIKRATQTDF